VNVDNLAADFILKNATLVCLATIWQAERLRYKMVRHSSSVATAKD
jgi:hypothetical protein